MRVVWAALGLLGFGVVGLVTGQPRAAQPAAAPTSGVLYFTTYQPATVQRATYSYEGGGLKVSSPTVVARLPGADGAVFGADGTLLVGGTDSGTVQAINVASGTVGRVPVGGPAAFMLALDPTGRTLYTSGLPGLLAAVPIDPLGPGRVIPLNGPDQKVTGVAFAPDGLVLYTSSGPDGTGDIGLLDLAHGTTVRVHAAAPAAHGVVYDPYTDSFLTIGGTTVMQLSARDPSQVESVLQVPGARLDQGTVDGHGRVFLASNDGRLILVDYSSTHHVGDLTNRTIVTPLVANLDDVAPLVGPGAPPAPATAPWWGTAGEYALVGAGVLFLVPIGRFVRRQRAQRRRALPKWDVRRPPPRPAEAPAPARRSSRRSLVKTR